MSPERLEQKCDEELGSDRSPAIQKPVIQQLEANDGYRETVGCVADGSDLEVEHKMRNHLAALQEWSGLDKGQLENGDRGIRRVVEAR